MRRAATHEEVEALIEAMTQLLDDMGPYGTCVCVAAKAQARIAWEPFRDDGLDMDPYFMTLADAQRVIDEVKT